MAQNDAPHPDLPARMEVAPADRKLRIAIAYSRLPFPMMRGDQLTVAHLVAYLAARGHDVDLYTLDLDGPVDALQNVWLKEKLAALHIYQQSPMARLLGVAWGLVHLWPMQIGYFFNPKLAADVRAAVMRGQYDIVYTYYLRSAPVTASRQDLANFRLHIAGRPVASFLAMQLSQTMNTERIYRNLRGGPRKWIYWLEYKLLQRYESRIWRRFSRTVLIGPKDVDAVTQACRKRGEKVIDNWVYGAHGTDVRKFVPAHANEVVPHRVVFSGSMLYRPNVQAVQWFLHHCWENVRAVYPDAEFLIVGRDPTREILAMDGINGVRVTGTVPDVGKFIRTAQVCINPMQAAGGMQNKLIEYMASAKAVVATSIANEGINAPAGEALIIADDAKDFTAAICTLMAPGNMAENMGAMARAFVIKHWTWEAHFAQLETDFLAALDLTEVT